MHLKTNVTPPVAKKEPFEIELHNIKRVDDYAWMKDENWQEVLNKPELLDQQIRDYLEAENAYTDQVTIDTKALQAELFEELKGRMAEEEVSAPSKDGDWYYYHRMEAGKQYPIYCQKFKSLAAEEEIIFDVNKAAEGFDYFSVSEMMVSPDHQKVAYAVDTNGSESYTLHVFDIETGQAVTPPIQGMAGNLVWVNDSETLYYITGDKPSRPNKLWRHRLGANQGQDEMLYTEEDEAFFAKLSKSADRKFVFFRKNSHTTSEHHFLDADDPQAELKLFAARLKDEKYLIDHGCGQFFIRTNRDALDFKIMTCPSDKTSRFNWQEFIGCQPGCLIKDIAVFEKYFVRLQQKKGLPAIIVRHLETGKEYTVDAADEAYDFDLIGAREFKTDIIRFVYTSPSMPRQVFDYNMTTRQDTVVKEQKIPSGHNPNDYIVERKIALDNGTQIPVTILYHKDTPIDESAPLWLYGYGAYGASIPAVFRHHHLTLVNRGFILAIAHVRGGKEGGYQWYLDGKLNKKANTFNDFIAVAEYLIEKRYTSKGNIYAEGRSAGGMLMGAITNMRPDLWKMVHGGVPFVDVLNTMSDETLPLTPPEWPEWGNPLKSMVEYNYIASYSPYDQVKAQAYPNILITAGLTDPRVTYWEPAKWLAKLRDYNTNEENLMIMKMEMGAGHGGASGRFDALKEYAFEYAVVLNVFGLVEEAETEIADQSAASDADQAALDSQVQQQPESPQQAAPSNPVSDEVEEPIPPHILNQNPYG